MVKKQKILSDDQLSELQDLYARLKNTKYCRFFNQWDNLYDVHRTQLWPAFKDHEVLNYLCEHFGMTYENSYFLSYTRGSFTATHVDTDKANLTLITLIDKTDDLIGGDVIVIKPLPKRELRGEFRGKEGTRARVGKLIVPEVWPQEVGESLIYDGGTTHGVTRVKKGERIVLVTWLKEKV